MNLARLIVDTGRRMARAPQWSALQWCAFTVLAVLAVFAREYRFSLQGLIAGRGGPLADALASFANVAGSGVSVTVLAVLALLLGLLLRKDELVQAAMVVAAAGFWAFLLVQVGRFALAEQRPLQGGGMRFLAWHGHGVSGHAAAAALLVAPLRDVLARGAAIPIRRAVTILVPCWALVVAWSRVWMGMHFVWNVLVGAALGLWAGAAAVAAWRGSVALDAPDARGRDA